MSAKRKACKHCGKLKPIAEFKYGRLQCTACQRETQARWVNANLERVKKYVRQYGVDPKAKYQITRIDRAEQPAQPAVSGDELLQKGLAVCIDERPGAVIVKYRKVP